MKEGYGAGGQLGWARWTSYFRFAVRGKLGLTRLAFLLLGLGLTEWWLFTLILTIHIQIGKTLISP